MSMSSNEPEVQSSWLDDVVAALEGLGGSAHYHEIYDAVHSARSSLPASWKDIVRRTIFHYSSDSKSFKGKDDLFFSVQGIGEGTWGLRSHVKLTPVAVDSPGNVDIPEGNAVPVRVDRLIYRILRDTELARKIKLLHRDRCQICGIALELSAGVTYSEAHHIIPLGKHGGPDTPENIIVLCPNHHALCDYGALKLEMVELKTVPGHEVSRESVDYHNEVIFQP